MIAQQRELHLSLDKPLNYSRPSIDLLFHSAADVYDEQTIGMVLTGANADGSKGLQKIKAVGGLSIVQDPDTAENGTMPRAAMEATDVDHVVHLNEIGPLLTELCQATELHHG